MFNQTWECSEPAEFEKPLMGFNQPKVGDVPQRLVGTVTKVLHFRAAVTTTHFLLDEEGFTLPKKLFQNL